MPPHGRWAKQRKKLGVHLVEVDLAQLGGIFDSPTGILFEIVAEQLEIAVCRSRRPGASTDRRNILDRVGAFRTVPLAFVEARHVRQIDRVRHLDIVEHGLHAVVEFARSRRCGRSARR
jgi:hypothetical protein